MQTQLSSAHTRALQMILKHLEGSKATWVLTGSLGMALQGVPLTVNDIDLQTTARGAYALEGHLAAWMQEPVRLRESKVIRSHWGQGEIGGVSFEIMGDVRVRLTDGSWRPKPDLTSLRRWELWQGWQVPVLSLAYEAEAYAALGRMEKAEMLKQFLAKTGGQAG